MALPLDVTTPDFFCLFPKVIKSWQILISHFMQNVISKPRPFKQRSFDLTIWPSLPQHSLFQNLKLLQVTTHNNDTTTESKILVTFNKVMIPFSTIMERNLYKLFCMKMKFCAFYLLTIIINFFFCNRREIHF